MAYRLILSKEKPAMATYGKAGTEMHDTLLTLKEVKALTGMARTTLLDLMRTGKFPGAIRMNCRTNRYSLNEIEAWIDQRKAERPARPKPGEDEAMSPRVKRGRTSQKQKESATNEEG